MSGRACVLRRSRPDPTRRGAPRHWRSSCPRTVAMTAARGARRSRSWRSRWRQAGVRGPLPLRATAGDGAGTQLDAGGRHSGLIGSEHHDPTPVRRPRRGRRASSRWPADQQPTFRSGVRTVPVYATAFDGSGRLVPDLEQDDFEVLDNGKPVTISSFSNEPQPFTVVVMLDTSASMTGHLKLLNQAAEQFLLRLLPVDRAQVGAFNDKLQLSGEFTNDRDDLIAALDDLQIGNSTRLWDGVGLQPRRAQGRGRPPRRAGLHRRRRHRQQGALRQRAGSGPRRGGDGLRASGCR